MKNKAIAFLFTLQLLLCALLIVQSVQKWLDPIRRGWPSEIYLFAEIVLIFALLMAISSTITFKARSINPNLKIGLLVCFLTFNLTVALDNDRLVYFFYHPPSFETVLADEQMDPIRFSQLPPCERVSVFSQIGYRFIDLHYGVVLFDEFWVHDALGKIPKGILTDCIVGELSKQISLMNESLYESEIPVRKAHALIFESLKLGVMDDSRIENLMGVMICEKNMDPFKRLIVPYYFVKTKGTGHILSYTDEGFQRLRDDVCN
jgi:hypothetical protein